MQHGVAVGGRPIANAFPEPGPLVWDAGTPRPEVAVVEMVEIGPLAERSVVLRPPAGGSLEAPAQASVAEGVWYDDGSTRWRLLAAGAVQHDRRATAAGLCEGRWMLRDAWTQRLDDPAAIAWSKRDGRLVPAGLPRLDVASAANRSATRHAVRGASVHVPTATGGERWRVADAMELLAAALLLPITWKSVAREIADTPLTRAVDLRGTIRQALTALLEPHGLALRIDFPGDAPNTRRLEVVSDRTARRVDIPRLVSGQPAVVRFEQRGDANPATRWTARGGVNEVESTFTLVGGWDPALETADDAQYDRSQSEDFPAYRDVFRTWVLNEDGRYSGAPYLRGAMPDLAALFENPYGSPRPLRFRDTLSLDASGQAQPPRVEISFDSGAAWTPYPGRVAVLESRAGVWLEDDALPAGWIASVRDGSARLRVTATLRDPQPLSHRRWDGNALRQGVIHRSVAAGEGFERRRVAPQSVLHGSAHGAVEADDRDTLAMWLDRWIDRQRRDGGSRLRVRLAGAGFTTLRTADRLRLDADGRRNAERSIVEIRHAFPAASEPGTSLTLEA